MLNPYLEADRRQARARRRIEASPLGWRPGRAGLLLAALLVLPLVQDTLYFFNAWQGDAWIMGFEGLLTRLGMGLAALLAFTTYDALVRGPDRGVVDLHPLLPDAYWWARGRSLLQGQAVWLGIAWIWLLPLWERPLALGVAAIGVTAAWLAGLGFGLWANLRAPDVAFDPAWAGTLDAIRGQNPRLQAALLYAPGAALIGAGLLVMLGAMGAGAVLRGQPWGWAALLAPLVGGGLTLLMSRPAIRSLERVPALLGEIDAAWGNVATAEEQREVYLDWLSLRLSGPLRWVVWKDLRQGWRTHRPWISATWLIGVGGLIAGWTADGVSRVRVGVALGLVVVGGVAVRMQAPAWLDAQLPISLATRIFGRAFVVFAWLQVALWPAVLAVAIRHEGAVAVAAWLVGLTALLAGVGALAGVRWPTRGWMIYTLVGAGLWLGGVQ